MSKYKVHWIFKWQYNIVNNIVIRQYFVKWWDSFKHQRIIDQVKQEFSIVIPTPIQQSPIAPIQQKSTTSVSQTYSTVRLGSPSSNIKTSKSKSKTKSNKTELLKDNTELLRVVNLLLAQVQAKSTIKEESDGSTDSEASEASTSKDPYESRSQDAYDPFA